MKQAMMWLFVMIVALRGLGAQDPLGFQGAGWGMSPAQVRQAAGVTGWQQQNSQTQFPDNTDITVYSSSQDVAGYAATVEWYFWNERFVQVTVNFDFDHLKTYDFNYNVFRSVDEYYHVIHGETLTFIDDIYSLLRKKYGKKKPVFKGIDPRFMFKRLDAYLSQERWNMRYNPSEYYRRIVAAGYARWDFPKTRIIFALNLSAPDKRFDYTLSLSSLDLAPIAREQKDRERMQEL